MLLQNPSACGRSRTDLYPELDDLVARQTDFDRLGETIWPDAKIVTKQLPELLLSLNDIPQWCWITVYQSLSNLGGAPNQQLREIQQIRSDMLKSRQQDWLAVLGFGGFVVYRANDS